MQDHILEAFLKRQHEQGMALAGDSDLLELIPSRERPPQRYVARLHCKGLIRQGNGEVAEANRFEVGVFFGRDYLRHADPFRVLTWLGPPNIYHPNVMAPAICVGRLVPGTPLVDLLYQVFEIVTYNAVTMDDALNGDACAWARHHQHLFPLDKRPLKWRAPRLQADVAGRDRAVSEVGNEHE